MCLNVTSCFTERKRLLAADQNSCNVLKAEHDFMHATWHPLDVSDQIKQLWSYLGMNSVATLTSC